MSRESHDGTVDTTASVVEQFELLQIKVDGLAKRVAKLEQGAHRIEPEEPEEAYRIGKEARVRTRPRGTLVYGKITKITAERVVIKPDNGGRSIYRAPKNVELLGTHYHVRPAPSPNGGRTRRSATN